MVIIGTGGLAKQLASFPCTPEIDVLFNDVNHEIDNFWSNYEVIKTLKGLADHFSQQSTDFVVAISNGSVRRSLEEKIVASGGNLTSVVSSSAQISKYASIGCGSIVLAQSLIEADVTIGKSCLLNVGAVITHDVVVEDHCDIGPKAILLGGAKISEGSSIGAGAVVMPRIQVGKNSKVGAGAVVTKDVLPGQTVVGIPAKVVQH